jgi:hypothetical protein
VRREIFLHQAKDFFCSCGKIFFQAKRLLFLLGEIFSFPWRVFNKREIPFFVKEKNSLFQGFSSAYWKKIPCSWEYFP